MIDTSLLDLLICPVSRSALRQEGDVLVGVVGGLRYPIRDGVPVLLPSEATLPEGVSSLDELRKKLNNQAQ